MREIFNVHRETSLPKTIDDPVKLLIWDIRDVVPFVVCIMIGILAGTLWPFLIVGFGLAYITRKMRDRRQDGWGLHFLYWIGLLPAKGCPNPYVRRLLP